MKIKEITVFEVLNSRANPTIAVEIETENSKVWASAPSGASVGKSEVKTYTVDVDSSIKIMNSLSDKLKGMEFNNFDDLKKIENLVKISKVGGNPIIALEFAVLKAWANEKKKPLWKLLNPKAKGMPKLLSNVVGGGSHATGGLDIQEILVYSNAKTFREGAFLNARIHEKLKKKLQRKDHYFLGGKTDEGAWTTYISDLEALKLVRETLDEEDTEMFMGIDLAASEIFSDDKYVWKNYGYKGRKKTLTRLEHIELIKKLIKKFDLKYIEDPLEENDFDGFTKLNEIDTNICGDDLTTTNLKRIRKAIRKKSISSIIIKPNQIGSVIETIKAIKLAKRAGLKVAVSHRSGSTEDSTLVHLAKAFEADFVKIGIAGGERIAKINELIRIEQGL